MSNIITFNTFIDHMFVFFTSNPISFLVYKVCRQSTGTNYAFVCIVFKREHNLTSTMALMVMDLSCVIPTRNV